MIRVGGIVLCGGMSQRMGRPKACLPIAGTTMLEHVIGILRQVVDPIVVVAAPDQEISALPSEIPVVRDSERGRGPLQGLSAGFAALEGRVEGAYVSSCDVPFLLPAFVRRLIDLLGDRAICVPKVGDHYHPLAAIYRLDVLKTVDRLLDEDRLRPFFLFDTVPTRVVEAHELADVDPTFESLRNLNTPEEYDQALRDFVSRTSHSTNSTATGDGMMPA
jgi:molybdopterin-guanine dinucleotide biosynthesis protein A